MHLEISKISKDLLSHLAKGSQKHAVSSEIQSEKGVQKIRIKRYCIQIRMCMLFKIVSYHFFILVRLPPPIKLTCHAITEILLKVALNTINQTFILLLLFEFLVLFWVSCLFWNSICIVILIFCGYYGNQNWIPYKSRIYETIIYFRMDMKVFRKCFTSSINFEKKSFYGIIDLLTNLIAWCLSCVNRMCCLSKCLV